MITADFNPSRAVPQAIVAIDAAYAEYAGADYDGGAALASELPNVVMLRTFSKIYGLGGLRVGWATGSQAVIDEINRVRAPFPISVPALAAAEAALEDQQFVADCRRKNREQRTRLADAITRLGNRVGNGGLRAIPSEANFVLMACPETGPLTAEAFHNGLAQRGYLTRWLPGQGLANALRISVGTEEETTGVIAALTELAESA